jgi:hypothetical protein
MKTKIYMLVLLVGVGLIVGALAYKNKGQDNTDVSPETARQEDQAKTKDTTATPSGNTFEGLLQASDDSSKGNFKLISGGHEIYIRTARDFSKLLGLQVMATISGTMDNFQLIDMQPSVQKDGFIISQ